MRTAVVIGSTGLIGEELVKKLASQGSWGSVLAVTRKSKTWSHPKIRNLVFDFSNWGDLELQVKSFAGNSNLDFFCCLGTTLKAAGSEASFRKIDLEAVVLFAAMAHICRAEQLFVVSSLGANLNSKLFYNRIKGEMEKAVALRYFGKIYFVRPSLLLGDRSEFRLAERLAMMLAPLYSIVLFGALEKFKPIRSVDVANAMILVSSKNKKASSIIENQELHELNR